MTLNYRYCGLTLASELSLPELPQTWPDAAPDLQIRFRPVPRELSGELRRTAAYAHNGVEALWWLEGIGRFRVQAGGRFLDVEPAPAADEAGLRVMLLHPVFALAAVLRGDWLLNAAAVERDGKVTALIGPSASGKSTAAALLLQNGFRLVSDSRLRLTRAADGRYLAHPQAPWLLLWPDTVRHLALEGILQEPAWPGIALRRLTLPYLAEARPIVRIGLLREQRGNDLDAFAPSPRPGSRGFETLLQHMAGCTWLDELADRRALFQWGVPLTARTRIECLEVPWGWAQCEALAEQLSAWCAAGSDAEVDRPECAGADPN